MFLNMFTSKFNFQELDNKRQLNNFVKPKLLSYFALRGQTWHTPYPEGSISFPRRFGPEKVILILLRNRTFPKHQRHLTLFLIHQPTQTPYARNNQTLAPRGFQAVIRT